MRTLAVEIHREVKVPIYRESVYHKNLNILTLGAVKGG